MLRTEDEKRGKRIIRVLIYGGIAMCKYEVKDGGFRPFGRQKIQKDEVECQRIALEDAMSRHFHRGALTAQMLGKIGHGNILDRVTVGYSSWT